ncbi:MAG: class I SAM-dependent methyltransferase, partial [Anaerolineales bacterium]
RHARRVLAVDVSDGLIQPGKRPDNFEFCFSDGLSVPAPAGLVDLAYSSQVMEHLHPDDAFEQLGNIYDALAPGGAYLCITPNRLSGPWDISRGRDDVASGLHLKEYTLGDLGRLFRAAGFRRVQVFLSVGGRIVSPRMPVGVIAAVERGLERLPPGLRRRLALGLTAVKIIGYK